MEKGDPSGDEMRWRNEYVKPKGQPRKREPCDRSHALAQAPAL